MSHKKAYKISRWFVKLCTLRMFLVYGKYSQVYAVLVIFEYWYDQQIISLLLLIKETLILKTIVLVVENNKGIFEQVKL